MFFLQVHYSHLWSSFAAKNIYQENEKKTKYIKSVRGNIFFVCVLQSNWKVPLDIIFIHIRLRAPLGILSLNTMSTRKARVSFSIILILFYKYIVAAVVIVYAISFAGCVNLLQLYSLNDSKCIILESTFHDISLGRLDNRPRFVVRFTALKPERKCKVSKVFFSLKGP